MSSFQLPANPFMFFCDFDGTVTIQDVGNRLFHHFSDAGSDAPVALWRADKIDARQCLLQEAELMRDVTMDDLYSFIDGCSIDPVFPRFAALCRMRKIPLYILSDGLDIYIQRILMTHGISDIPVSANHAELDGRRLMISFPLGTDGCPRCGNCKGFQIRNLRKGGFKTIYVGDGKSDLCALPEADIVFAKGFLAEYCLQNRIDFHPFESFTSLVQLLEAIS
jgi:2-hydroxy-3-keto-5-methylthiopentenyl-1-phosphate phosphatase